MSVAHGGFPGGAGGGGQDPNGNPYEKPRSPSALSGDEDEELNNGDLRPRVRNRLSSFTQLSPYKRPSTAISGGPTTPTRVDGILAARNAANAAKKARSQSEGGSPQQPVRPLGPLPRLSMPHPQQGVLPHNRHAGAPAAPPQQQAWRNPRQDSSDSSGSGEGRGDSDNSGDGEREARFDPFNSYSAEAAASGASPPAAASGTSPAAAASGASPR
ncbi:hypothetical protein PFISCL1PPCAC_13703, partial [Pristionchus fissidentatus]